VFGSIYLLAAPAAPEAGSYLQAAHIRQLHRDDKIQLKVHAVVSKPATGSDANAPAPAGTAKFVIPELSIDVSKQFSGSEDDFKEGGACRRVASGEGGSRAECNVFVEVGEGGRRAGGGCGWLGRHCNLGSALASQRHLKRQDLHSGIVSPLSPKPQHLTITQWQRICRDEAL
jgi:hypothetical protein